MKLILGVRLHILTMICLCVLLSGCGGGTGLVAHKYTGSWSNLPNFSQLTPVDQIVIPTVGTHNIGANNYGLVIKGILRINQPGQYRFHLRSDDGSKLAIDSNIVIQNDGIHNAQTKSSNNLLLAEGDHEIRIEYFQANNGQTLELSYQFNNGPITAVDASMLFHKAVHKETDSDSGSGGGDGSGHATDRLTANQELTLGQWLANPNDSVHFHLQSDGNLVLRDVASGDAIWSAGTQGEGGNRLIMQSDGNLVLYTESNDPVWASNTVGSGQPMLQLFNDGSLILFHNSTKMWAINDNGSGSEGVKIAFIGDTGTGSNFQNVLNLIKQEGAELTIVAGDTSYSSSRDDNWDSMVRSTLGSSDPALIAAGNHDYGDSNFNDVRSFGENRLNKANNVSCSGTYAEKMTCRYKNVYIVLSAIGSSGSRSDHENYISNSLNNAPDGAWRICAWHKNQRNMQVGGKGDEVGWTAYETCRNHGAIIATGHEHSYSRTHLLSDMSDQRIASTSSTFTISEGKTFAFVSGLGGIGIRDQERGGNWWASIYTSTQGATYGAMFGTFYDDHAEFYFKNINGKVIDQFTVNKGY